MVTAVCTKKDSSPKKTKSLRTGLCQNCNHGESCTITNQDGRDVHLCEEFDSYVPVLPKSIRSSLNINADSSENTIKGLCANCENNSICSYAKTEGGVWQCEEYK